MTANKDFATKYEVMFSEGVKYLFHSLKYESIYNFFKCTFLDFYVVILSLTVKINLPLKW